MRHVGITGIGLVTPLGRSPREVLQRIESHESAAVRPSFATESFDCPVCAPVDNFCAEDTFPGNKSLRFMSRDAQLAVVGAHLALEDADLRPGQTYASEEIALYGSTGVAGMTVEEVAKIVQHAVGDDGALDLQRFGRRALKRIRPVLSFKILANMPICFVSIFHNIRGPNAVFTPWEGHGAQAIAAGVRAIRSGEVPCALVGGCDVKTYELAFINLQQLGLFESWRRSGRGCVPGEGAAFLVLEDERSAASRGRRGYARIADYKLGSTGRQRGLGETLGDVVSELRQPRAECTVFAAADGDIDLSERESAALTASGYDASRAIEPKRFLGNLFAASAATQVALAAAYLDLNDAGRETLANCFGYGTEQASFLLEPSCSAL